MSKLPIGVVLRQIFDEKAITPSHLMATLGKSKPAVYNNFKRTEMDNEEIANWAKALGVSSEEIVKRWKGDSDKGSVPGDSAYLATYLARLEEHFKQLNEQLRVQQEQFNAQLAMKDRQLEGMQRTVDVLLGKYNPAADRSKEFTFLQVA
ncbi:hypothetical protein GCM10010967_12250 [Dyadobacter beijingensis]|uniref:HTH cro/C1-type domain-containing protein n=1 Tax=Dyadobacter beijingensis TaxID=365489 RepID=A0ABQ2HJM9_9BACT|nr:hypothetical protein [Dyadobacter beijingensis]GGM82090.1 hypothetical protein GCM10010967_12250 [Dyadobacter beijingensis]